MTIDQTGEGAETRIAIVVSRFNEKVTSGLLKGALACLKEQGVSVKEENIIAAPGAFEIPLIAQTLALSGQVDGVVCLGCVIKGETAHFEYISHSASWGLMSASLKSGVPLSFGILSTYDADQAVARSGEDADNKGREAAMACLDTLKTIRRITRR